jgi:hypothetical protein
VTRAGRAEWIIPASTTHDICVSPRAGSR